MEGVRRCETSLRTRPREYIATRSVEIQVSNVQKCGDSLAVVSLAR